jgi:hypothetical protein
MAWNRGLMVSLLGALSICSVLALPSEAAERIRPSALAGTWYPADPQELAGYVDRLLNAVESDTTEMRVRALVAPHAGYRYSGATAAKVIARVRDHEYKRVMALAPTHRSGFRGLSIAEVDAYETPLGAVPLDGPAIAELRKSNLVSSDPIAHVREHAIEIELPLLQRALRPGWRLVPVLVGQMEEGDYKAAADLLRPLADETTLIVVSSDFTHFGPRFGYVPFALNAETPAKIRALDDGAIDRILAGDAAGFLDYQASTGITICGYRPLAVLLNLLPDNARIQRIAYATSGELTGDWGNSVSYVGLLVTSPAPFSNNGVEEADNARGIDTADLARLHRLAVLGVEEAVLGRSDARSADIREIVDGLPERLKANSGAFVTLKRGGQLRGCIGYIQPRKPLFQAVLENGFNAARNDWRFMPVRPDELGDIEVEVSVLSVPESIDSLDQFLVGEQGVILDKDGHQAVFLPEVATEQGWTKDDTLSHLAQKAGLPPDGWREGASFQVFTSAKYTAPYPAPSRASDPLAGSGSVPQDQVAPSNP